MQYWGVRLVTQNRRERNCTTVLPRPSEIELKLTHIKDLTDSFWTLTISFFCNSYLRYVTNHYVSKDTKNNPIEKGTKMNMWFTELNRYLVSLVIKEN